MEFTAWIRQWLTQHPLKTSERVSRETYTAQVMARVKGEVEQAASPLHAARSVRVAWPWPRLALAALTAAAVVIIVTNMRQETVLRLTQEVTRDAQLLAALGEPVTDSMAPRDLEAMAKELEEADRLMLAEAPPSDDQWLEQTLQLLEQFDEDASAGKMDDASSDEDLLKELQNDEQSDFAAAS